MKISGKNLDEIIDNIFDDLEKEVKNIVPNSKR